MTPNLDEGDGPAQVTPAELKSILGWLGLSRPWLGRRLNVQERTVIRWEDGDTKIPEMASAELVVVWNHTVECVKTLVEQGIEDRTDDTITFRTFRTDEDYWAQTGSDEYPASWHRALVCRAMDQVLVRTNYNVVIRYAGEWSRPGRL